MHNIKRTSLMVIFTMIFVYIAVGINVSEASAKKVCVVFGNSNVLVLTDEWESEYTAVDWYTGFVEEGDWLHGEVESYGSHEFYNITKDQTISCYVDEYMLSREEVIRWLKNRIR